MSVDRINAKLEQVLFLPDHHDPLLIEAVRRTVLAGGSRVRPILFTQIVQGVRNPGDSDLKMACAFEILHASSLILDDLPCMDNSSERRNAESCHVAYGSELSNLAAAWMQFYATSMIAECLADVDASKAIEGKADTIIFGWLVRAIDRAVSGQMLDLRGEIASQQGLLRVYALKTGAIFECVAKTAAYWTGATSSEIRLLGRYGRIFGIAFQLRDDLSEIDDLAVNPKERSFVTLWGREAAVSALRRLESLLNEIIAKCGERASGLVSLQVLFDLGRI